MKVISLGSWASYGLKGKKHFSLILEHRGKRAWIDPAVGYSEPVDFILLSSPDEDHWRYLPKYLEKYPDTPIYSTRAVINHMRLLLPKANWKRAEKPIKLGGKAIKLMAIPRMVGKPAVAFKVGSGRDAIVIIPEFIRLGDQEKRLMAGTVWVIGVGEYEKPKSDDHKATFKDLLTLAEELKPRKIYITNYRKSLLKHKREILEALKPWNGEFLNDGDEFEVKVKAIRKANGLYLVKPHAEFIYKGLKTMILKSKKFNIANKRFVLCDNDYAYGIVVLAEPEVINDWREFYLYAKEHLISLSEVKKWNWNLPLYAYRIKSFKPFSKKKAVKLPKGIQTFVNDIEQYYITEKLHLDEFRSEGVDYDLEHPKERWKELIADLRYLGNSGYPRLKRGKKWGDWKLTDVLKYFAKIVDALRSVYFPLIPPFDEELYKSYYGKDPKKAKESSFWKCYKEAEKYMKSKPPSTIEEAKKWDKKRGGIIKKARVKPGYYSKAKPYYRGYFQELSDELKSIGWDEHKLLIDTKWDGVRMTIGRAGTEGFAFVDPEGLKKKSPDISKRIPAIIKEIEKIVPPNTVLDGEFLALHPNKTEMLHRTVANALLNSKISGKELEDYAIIFVFDVLYYDGIDIRDQPLHERLEYLSRINSSEHIWIEKVSTKFPAKADAFVIDGKDINKIPKIAEFIRYAKNGRPRFCAEGIMIKRLDYPYEEDQNKGWMKVKFYHELDLRVISKKLVKHTKDVYNYYCGYDINNDWAEKYLAMTTKDWYGKVHVLKGNKLLASGKDAKEYLGRKDVQFVMLMGKTDNHKELNPIDVGDILRVAPEEVLEFDNPTYPDYPRYSFYIARVLEPVPEKSVTDSIDVLEKLSAQEPIRIPVDELQHLKEIVNRAKKAIDKKTICEWVDMKRIPEEEYKRLAKESQPLPKPLYINYDEGIAWAQMHIRGLDPDDTKKYLDGKLSFAKLIEGHSIHCLTGDTEIFIRDGYGRVQIRPLGSLLRTDAFPEVLTPNGWKKIIAFIKRGKERVFKIKLRNGIEIKATADHPHIVYRNYGHAGKLQKWKLLTLPTSELKPGDALMYTSGYDGDNIGDYDFGRFIGLYTGDGTSYIDHIQFTFTGDELAYANFVYEYARKLGAKCKIFEDKDKFALRVSCYSKGLVQLIADYVNKDKTFTWRVWRLSREARKGILDGIWQADGRKKTASHNIGLRNKRLRDQLSYLAASLGLMYTTRDYDYKGLVENRIVISPSQDKYNYTKRFVNNIAAVKIESIEEISEKMDVYDITVDEVPMFTLANGIVTHNCDLRMKFKNSFVQWVITQNAIPDYFDTLIGRRDPRTGNVSKGLAIVKPSAEEPSQIVKAKEELIIGPEDAKLIEKYVLFDKSYIIEAGDVGSTPYKDAYMCAIWLGKVKAGVQRPDLHEYFLYPNDGLPDKNKELFNGRFIIRCFRAGKDKRWWVWKATDDPYPMDPIMHADCGHYYPIKAEELDKFGREAYREESVGLYRRKLKC